MTDIENLRQRIIAQTNSVPEGWMDLHVDISEQETKILKIPRGAFEQWSVRRHMGGHLAFPWRVISPVGVKQGMDDPYHTDWILGAGLQPMDMRYCGDNSWWQELSHAAYAKQYEVQERVLNFEANVILTGSAKTGLVIKPKTMDEALKEIRNWNKDEPPILIIRDARSEWLESVLKVFKMGGALIVERGGEMAHLVTEIRGENAGPIMRVPDALQRYPTDCLLTIVPHTGTIVMMEGDYVPYNDYPEPNLTPVESQVVASPISKSLDDVRFTKVYTDKSHPLEDYHWIHPVAKVVGRDFQVYASLVWNGRESEEIQALKIYISSIKNHDSKTKTIGTNFRKWKDGEFSAACRKALLLVEPSERRDSPESVALCDTRANEFSIVHQDKDNSKFLEYVMNHVRNSEDLENNPPYIDDIDYEYDQASWILRDILSDCAIEIKRRGLPDNIWDLEQLIREENNITPII